MTSLPCFVGGRELCAFVVLSAPLLTQNRQDFLPRVYAKAEGVAEEPLKLLPETERHLDVCSISESQNVVLPVNTQPLTKTWLWNPETA